MASRGRKAPSKGGKGSSAARKAVSADQEETPGPEAKPSAPSLNNTVSSLKNEFLRADSEMEGSVNGFSTPPPPGSLTPFGPNGTTKGANGSQADFTDADGTGASVNGFALEEDADLDDLEYKTWKQVTKKDRATIAAERHRLFRDEQLQPEEPAILRTKAAMRRWLRHRKQALEDEALAGPVSAPDGKDGVTVAGESLAEGIQDEEERQIPDYYDPVCAIPDLNERLQWVEDSEGHVIQQTEEYMRIFPQGQFVAPDSSLTEKMDKNMHSLQETRKICAKIGIVKQMQLQSQLYQNQFQKYEPQPFMEADIEPMVVSEEGAIMAPYVCRAALQRSVGKIFYHAGFEEFQPSALDAVTDIAARFFQNLVTTLGVYRETPKTKAEAPVSLPNGQLTSWVPRYTQEEAVLHSLHVNGVDLESLETYVKEDVERLGTKLASMHDRMRSYYAELLRPALENAGADGAGAFNDGSEQFVGGDFAEDIGEDFFGFKELGLDREFGLTFSVPLHLLQNRVHNAYARQDNRYVAIRALFAISLTLLAMLPQLASSWMNRRSLSLLLYSVLRTKLALCETGCSTNFKTTTTKHLWKMMTCLPNSASLSHVCLPRVRSRVPVSARCENSNSLPGRSVKWTKRRKRMATKTVLGMGVFSKDWASPLVNLSLSHLTETTTASKSRKKTTAAECLARRSRFRRAIRSTPATNPHSQSSYRLLGNTFERSFRPNNLRIVHSS
jgi:transcriptional activator SPT7